MTSSQPKHPDRIALIGGGGHALVVAESILLSPAVSPCVLDDAEAPTVCASLGLTRLGGLDTPLDANMAWILCLGDLVRRRQWLDRRPVGTPVSVIHPQAWVSPRATIGRGVFIGPRAIVHTAARIGDHAIINTAAIIEHECEIGEDTHVAPGVVLGGRVRIGPETLIGLGTRVLPNVTIGAGCTLGAGSVVLSDVPDHSTYAGVPARNLRTPRG